jgi:hypothetical protein
MGKFSSDRSIRDYCEPVRQVKPVKVPPLNTVARTRDARALRNGFRDSETAHAH